MTPGEWARATWRAFFSKYSAAGAGLARAVTRVQARAKPQVKARVGRVGISYLHRFKVAAA
jgi:hypothetical protein